LRCRRPIAHCNCTAVLPPIAPPLPIPAAAVNCDLATAVHCDCRCRPSCVTSHCAASMTTAIVRHQLCHPLQHRCPIAHCNCFAVPLPIATPLTITAASIHRNHAAAVHCGHHCHPCCVAFHCSASALLAIVHRPLCHPSCPRRPIAHCNHSAVLPPIVPLFSITADAVNCNLPTAVQRDCRCHPSYIATHCAASALALELASVLVALALAMVLQHPRDSSMHKQETHWRWSDSNGGTTQRSWGGAGGGQW
jgi:hypothetical protein